MVANQYRILVASKHQEIYKDTMEPPNLMRQICVAVMQWKEIKTKNSEEKHHLCREVGIRIYVVGLKGRFRI